MTKNRPGNAMEASKSRSSKPLMEKRRRARINSSLAELKSLVVDSNRKENARYNKLEKADILEMAVKHLQLLHRQKAAATAVSKFQAGFTECVNQVSQCIDHLDGLDSDTRLTLLAHLANCLNKIRANTSLLQQPHDLMNSSSHQFATTSTNSANYNANFNANGGAVYPGVQLVASRLPSGELAFVVPCCKVEGSAPVITCGSGSNNFQVEGGKEEIVQEKNEDSESVWRPW